MTIAPQMFVMLSFVAVIASIAEWPWLKFIPLIAAFAIAVCEALSRKTDRRWLHKFLVPLLSATALVASCWIVWLDDKTARESRTNETLHLTRIEGRLGDDEATKRYLDAVANLTRQLTAAKTGSSVDKFFNSRTERQKLRDEVDQANQKLLLAHEIRINPVRDYIVAKFDNWMSEIQKHGINPRISKNDLPVVKIGPRDAVVSRICTFESGDNAQLQFYPAIIADGHLTVPLQCRMDFYSNRGKGSDLVFQIVIEEKGYRTLVTRPRFTFKPYDGNSENPIEDKEFIGSLDEALDDAMTFIVEEATSSK